MPIFAVDIIIMLVYINAETEPNAHTTIVFLLMYFHSILTAGHGHPSNRVFYYFAIVLDLSMS